MHFDPRTALVTTIAKSGPFGKKGDFVAQAGIVKLKNAQVGFILPSHSALLLDLSNRYFRETENFLVFKNFKRNKAGNHSPNNISDFYDFLTKRIVSIILPYDALESFINLEILLASQNSPERFGKYDPDKISLGLRGKIFTLMPVLYGIGTLFPSSHLKTMEENFEYINQARNKFIHVKPEDILSKHGYTDTIWNFLCSKDFKNYSKISKNLIENLCDFKTGKPYWIQHLNI